MITPLFDAVRCSRSIVAVRRSGTSQDQSSWKIGWRDDVSDSHSQRISSPGNYTWRENYACDSRCVHKLGLRNIHVTSVQAVCFSFCSILAHSSRVVKSVNRTFIPTHCCGDHLQWKRTGSVFSTGTTVLLAVMKSGIWGGRDVSRYILPWIGLESPQSQQHTAPRLSVT